MSNQIIQMPEQKFAGLFRVEVFDGPSGKRKLDTDWMPDTRSNHQTIPTIERLLKKGDSGWTPNLIVTAGLEAIGDHTKDIARYCVVGTGNATPVNGDSQLQAPLAVMDGNSNPQFSTGIVIGSYGWQRRVYQFAQGAVVGNLAEVGVGWSNSPATGVFSRALISPVVATISSDIVVITYELRMYIPFGTVSGTMTIAGAGDFDYDIKSLCTSTNAAAGIGSGRGWAPRLLGIGTSSPARQWATDTACCSLYKPPCVLVPTDETTLRTTTGGSAATSIANASSSLTNVPYETGMLRCNFHFFYNIDNGNDAAGIKGIVYTGLFGTYQMLLSAPIMKDNTKQLTLKFRQAWARRTL